MSIGIYLSFPFSKPPARGLSWGSFRFQKRLVKSYLDSLQQELFTSQFSGSSASTVLLGGGDWSLVRPEDFTKCVSILKGKYGLAKKYEFTIETAYDGLESENVTVWREMGANRLSFNPLEVGLNQLKRALLLARNKGFENLNFDLHFGLPGQTLFDWQKELKALICLRPTHFSVCSFGSSATRQNLRKSIYLWTRDHLEQNGFRHYEVCHFCRPGFVCRQNLRYWQRKNFLGFGAGAASLWGDYRWRNAVNPIKYAELIKSENRAIIQKYKIDLSQQRAENIYYSLRQARGLSLESLLSGLGVQNQIHRSKLVQKLIEKGYLSSRGPYLNLTKEGLLMADEVIAKLI